MYKEFGHNQLVLSKTTLCGIVNLITHKLYFYYFLKRLAIIVNLFEKCCGKYFSNK